jgi:undecaprenyl diphosphate synthase
MNQSTLHCAIIMDGNGRWAAARGLPRVAGHRAGADALRRAVEAAPGAGIGTLTLFAFSSDNWRRPPGEVAALMTLFDAHLKNETARCARQGVRIEFIGRRDRLQPSLRREMERAEAETAAGLNLRLRIAVDYSAREAIRAGDIGPAVDLLIRTGGEQRLSDFLLWECAYAELIFSRRMWPDFGRSDLEAAVREFRGRERRFGGLPEMPANGHMRPQRDGAWLD